jgi:hypothetical protein
VIVLAIFLALVVFVIAGYGYEHHVRRHLPHDLRNVGTEGLPSEASIRSGELGRGSAGLIVQNFDAGGGGS